MECSRWPAQPEKGRVKVVGVEDGEGLFCQSAAQALALMNASAQASTAARSWGIFIFIVAGVGLCYISTVAQNGRLAADGY